MIGAAGCKTFSLHPRSGEQGVSNKKNLNLTQIFKQEATTPSAAKPTEKVVADAMLPFFEARVRYLKKDYAKATELLKKSLSHDKNYLPAQSLLLKIYVETGQSQLAEKQAKNLIKLSPKDPYANYVLGMVFLEHKQNKRGLSRLYRAFRAWNDEDNPPPVYYVITATKLAGTLTRQGYLNGAVEIYKPLIRNIETLTKSNSMRNRRTKEILELHLPGFYLVTAELSAKLQKFEQANTYFRKLKTFPQFRTRAMIGLVITALQSGKKQQAKELLDKIVKEGIIDDRIIELYKKMYGEKHWAERISNKFNPTKKNINNAVKLAAELERNKNYDLTVNLIYKIIKIDPINTNAIIILIRSSQKNNSSGQAARILLKTITNPNSSITLAPVILRTANPAIGSRLINAIGKIPTKKNQEFAKYFLLGLSWQIISNYHKAEVYYRQSLHLNNEFLPTYLILGKLMIYNRQWNQLQQLADSAPKKIAHSASILYLKGYAQNQKGRLKQAIDYFRQAFEANPYSGQTSLALAEAYLQNRQPKKSISQIQHIVANNLVTPQTLNRITSLLLNLGDYSAINNLLKKYRTQFGFDSSFQLCTAKLKYSVNLHASEYRKRLILLEKQDLPAGQVALELAQLEFDLHNYRRAAAIASGVIDGKKLILPEYYYALSKIAGTSYWKLLEYEKSEKIWKSLIHDWPNFPNLKYTLGKMYLDAQMYSKAERVFSEILNSASTTQTPTLQQNLVLSLLGQDKLNRAVEKIDDWLKSSEGANRYRLLRMKFNAYLREKKFASAAAFARTLIQSEEKPVSEWQRLRIMALLKNNQAKKAEEYLDTLLKSASSAERPSLETLKITILVNSHKYNQAISITKNMLDHAPKNRQFILSLLLVQCYQKAKKYDESIRVAKSALKEYPENSLMAFSFQKQIVASLHSAGKPKVAEKYILEHLASSKPAFRGSWKQLLVSLYMQTDQIDKAISSLEDILLSNPNLAWANNSLGYTLANANRDLPRSKRLIMKAIADAPSNSAFLDSLAWVLYRQGKYNDALKYEIMSKNSMTGMDPVFFEHLGDIYFKLGNVKLAKKYWKQSVVRCKNSDPSELEPNMPERIIQKLKDLEQVK